MITISVKPFKTIPDLPLLLAGFPGIRGIFFDMDGTLFNTEAYHTEALIKIGLEQKIRPPYAPEKVHELMMGKADYLVYEIVKSWEGFPTHWGAEEFNNEKNKNLLQILSKTNAAEYFPLDTLSLLKEIKDQKIFVGLVTSSEKVITQKLLSFAGIENFFDLVLTRDDCPEHKPKPWPYLKAIELSQFLPQETLIFEDSNVGLASATASGAHVIKVEWF